MLDLGSLCAEERHCRCVMVGSRLGRETPLGSRTGMVNRKSIVSLIGQWSYIHLWMSEYTGVSTATVVPATIPATRLLLTCHFEPRAA